MWINLNLWMGEITNTHNTSLLPGTFSLQNGSTALDHRDVVRIKRGKNPGSRFEYLVGWLNHKHRAVGRGDRIFPVRPEIGCFLDLCRQGSSLRALGVKADAAGA